MKYSIYALFTACLLIHFSLSAMDEVKVALLSEEQLENIELGRIIQNGRPLIQLKVLNQFTTPGSSAASCSLHGLRNTGVVTHAAQHPEASLEEELLSQEHMNEQLGPHGAWRKIIQDKRRGTNGDWLEDYELNALIEKVINEGEIKNASVGIYGHISQGQFDPHDTLEQNSVHVNEVVEAQSNDPFNPH